MQRFEEFFLSWISGYYANAYIGRDFYTAVNASKFFGGAIAKYILKNLENSNLKLPINIIDLGANNLKLINDIYDFLDALSVGVVDNCNFIAVESNKTNKPQNKIKIIKNLRELEKLECDSFFVANEFFDALPCSLYDDGKVAYINDNKIEFLQNIDEEILEITKKEGFTKGEIPLSYFDFCKELDSINADSMKWIFCVFDYGNKIYKNDFSIRIFHNHKVFSLIQNDRLDENAMALYQKSDITYDVPFGILDMAFKCIDGKNVLYKTQDLALIEDFEILELLEQFHNQASSQTYIRESNKIKTILNVLGREFKSAIYRNF